MALSLLMVILALNSCQNQKLFGEYSGEYNDLSLFPPAQYLNQPRAKKYTTVIDSNGVIRMEPNSYVSHGGNHNLHIESQNPYMTQSVVIYAKRGMKVAVTFQFYLPSYKTISFFGDANLSGDTLITPLIPGDTLFGPPLTVKYLLQYDAYKDENYLYYSPDLNKPLGA